MKQRVIIERRELLGDVEYQIHKLPNDVDTFDAIKEKTLAEIKAEYGNGQCIVDADVQKRIEDLTVEDLDNIDNVLYVTNGAELLEVGLIQPDRGVVSYDSTYVFFDYAVVDI